MEPESTRPANEYEVADALGTVENVVWDMAIQTMPGGGTRFALSDVADAHLQSWLTAVAMDAAEQSTQEAGPGNGVDRLRALRGIFSLALAHIGEAIQSLEPDTEQVGVATSASGIQHEMRLGTAAEPRTDAAYEALMQVADQAFHTVPNDHRDDVTAQVNLVLEALGRNQRVMRVPR